MTAPEAGPSGTPVGDTARQKAIDALCEAFAEDRIGVDDFERRVEVAHRAETLEELRALLAGLPRPPAPVRAARGDRAPSTEAELLPALRMGRRPTLPPEQVRPTSFIAGIMGGGSRRGAWHPARVNYAMGFMGGFSLDLRETPLPPGVTEIKIFAMWGGGEIIVPPDVVVEVSAMGILGGFDYDHAVPGTLDPDAPIVRITGVCVMGGASIVARYPGESAGDMKRRLRQEKKERKRALKRPGWREER